MITFAKNTYEKTNNKKIIEHYLKNKIHRKKLVPEILVIVLFVLLNFILKSNAMNFDETRFNSDVIRIHGTVDTTISASEVRRKLDEFIDYDPIFSKALDKICENFVGRTMFNLLIKQIEIEEKDKIKLVNNTSAHGSSFSPGKFMITVNADLYDDNGIGINSYYGSIKDEHLVPIRKTIYSSIFHEFCHAFHNISSIHFSRGVQLNDFDRMIFSSINEPNDRAARSELRVITGYIEDGQFDPISCYYYDLYEYLSGHSKEFLPRYGHFGYHVEEDGMTYRELNSRLNTELLHSLYNYPQRILHVMPTELYQIS